MKIRKLMKSLSLNYIIENDGTPVWTEADLSFDNEIEENIYGFIKKMLWNH